MKGNRMLNDKLLLIGLVTVLAWSAAARGQAWLAFVEDPSRISAAEGVINDLPCDSNCPGGCGDFLGCECACEKDMAVGDLDNSFPSRDDLVIVRMQPQLTGGGVSNLLFMNENGIMVDRTADFAPCFADPTQDRDVVMVDVDPITGQVWRDVVIAATFGEQPRVYVNLGNDVDGNWRGLCLCYDKETDTCHDQSYLTTHGVCYQDAANNCFVDIPVLNDELRIQFKCFDAQGDPVPCASPFFCGVAAGDVNMDDCDDLYFVDYDNTLEDRLLFNIKTGGVCTGFFDDVTETPSTRLCPDGQPCFNESGFGTGARIIDIDKDGNNDIVKGEDQKLSVIYNDANNVGHFDVKQDLHVEFRDDFPGGMNNAPYMFADDDLNNDFSIDLYVVMEDQDSFLINKCVDPLTK